MRRETLLYILMVMLFVAGASGALLASWRVGALFVSSSGVIAIMFAPSHASVQRRINEATRHFTWNPWGNPRPQLFVVWGIAMILIGFAWAFM